MDDACNFGGVTSPALIAVARPCSIYRDKLIPTVLEKLISTVISLAKSHTSHQRSYNAAEGLCRVLC